MTLSAPTYSNRGNGKVILLSLLHVPDGDLVGIYSNSDCTTLIQSGTVASGLFHFLLVESQMGQTLIILLSRILTQTLVVT